MTFNFVQENFHIGQASPDLSPQFIFYRKGFNIGGSASPSWREVTVSGIGAVTLVNAIDEGLLSLTLFGATEQSNLPSGYTQLRYVQNTANTTKINTGVMPEVGDELEVRFITPYTAATSNYLLQSRENANAGIFGISGSQTGKTIILTWGAGNSVTSAITREYNHEYIVKASVIGTTLTLYVKDVTTGTEDTVTGTITNPSDATTPYYIWGNTSQYLGQITPVYYAKITNNGTTKLNYVAAKDSNNSASFYDLVNNTFITNFDGTITGSADVATPTPATPISILTNNGTIKVSKNLFDMSKAVLGDIASADGSISTNVLYRIVSDYIPVQVGRSYIASGFLRFENLPDDYIVRLIIAFYDSNKGYISGSRTTSSLGFTIPNNGASYVRVEFWGDPASGNTVDLVNSKLQFELGTTATTYTPYGMYIDGTTETVTDELGNTATAEMLLAIDNFKDTQSVLDGTVTRNIGIKVFDGTENWSRTDARLSLVLGDNSTDESFSPYCTHYKGYPASMTLGSLPDNGCKFSSATNSPILIKDSVHNVDTDTWKAYLAQEYANGTPVILIYPTSSSTIETVEGQVLTTEAGTNVIAATGSLDNLGLEVSYKGT